MRALFVGKGKARTAWYRVFLPAIYMGADWSGLEGEPPNEIHVTGQVGDNTQRPNMFDYDVVVIQQPATSGWLDHIKKLRSAGVKVLLEIDDYVHGIPRKKDHDFRDHFTPEYLRGLERCMRACDGLIVSTEYLAKRYRQFNDQVWVCHNALDVARYRLTRPPRPYCLPAGVRQVPLYGGAGRREDGTFATATRRVEWAFVDEADYDRVIQQRWLLHPSGYAYRCEGSERRNVYLHREVMVPPEGMSVDHRNTDKRDCRRANLEVVTEAENKRRRMFQPGEPNRGIRPNKSGKWTAYVDTPEGRKWLGHTHLTEDAARAVVDEFRAANLPPIGGPARVKQMVQIGWAGATAHAEAVMPWLQAVANVMFRRENTCFVSIGQPFAEPFKEHFPTRAITIPFTMLETYPAAMTMFDVALAPAGRGLFYRGKSDLRWLEAGALGIPVIASPKVYSKIEHGVTGFHASSAEEVEELLLGLVDNEEKRTTVGASAKDYVLNNRSMEVGVEQWRAALKDAVRAGA